LVFAAGFLLGSQSSDSCPRHTSALSAVSSALLSAPFSSIFDFSSRVARHHSAVFEGFGKSAEKRLSKASEPGLHQVLSKTDLAFLWPL
jgi:hypothetical protein